MHKPRVLIVGGPDVDARIPLILLMRNDFDIVVLGSNPLLEKLFASEGLNYLTYYLDRKFNPFSDIRTFIELFYKIRKLNPQIVHAFDTKPSVFGRLAARIAGVPFIVGTLPGLGYIYAADTLLSKLVRLFYQPLQKLASRSSEITIFQNLDDANQFRSSGIVKQENTIVIPGSGVDTSEFSAAHVPEIERIRVRNDLQISLDAFVVTMISRLIRSKGVMDFVKAAEYLQQHKSDIKFLLIGPLDEDSLDRLNPQELELLKRNVIWPGFRKDIRTILCASDLFVLPSYYREGVPRVLLEAAAMELPIITADSPGCIEVITNNVNGLLIPPQNPEALAQAISRLARDYEKRRTLGLAARRTVTSQFDISIIASEIGTLYLRLLSKRNGASEAIPRI